MRGDGSIGGEQPPPKKTTAANKVPAGFLGDEYYYSILERIISLILAIFDWHRIAVNDGATLALPDFSQKRS
jgi:hypothetical protein